MSYRSPSTHLCPEAPISTRPARRRPTQERARETREAILKAAGELFAERGIAATSTNRIAQHAHISIGALYRYFDDKHEIARELGERLATDLEQRFTAAVLAGLGQDTEAAIAGGLRGVVAAIREQQGLLRALAAETSIEGVSSQAMEQRLLLLTRAWLLHEQGAQPDDVIDVRAWVMVGVGLATSLRVGLDPPPDLDTDRLVDETARMLALWVAAGQRR